MEWTLLKVSNTSESVAVNDRRERGISYLAPMSVENAPSLLPCASNEGDR